AIIPPPHRSSVWAEGDHELWQVSQLFAEDWKSEGQSELHACRVPCDYIPKRSYPLFRTSQILDKANDILCHVRHLSKALILCVFYYRPIS
ncbi:hypothetical protein, partial [Thiolapillus sp.]|uniref:hypothetical protein n=1 Tax=Thiolapillus sp. TaxID=2017437 RepID=UPI003AF7E694